MYVSLMCVYRCRQFDDINCRLQLYKLEAKKKKKKKKKNTILIKQSSFLE